MIRPSNIQKQIDDSIAICLDYYLKSTHSEKTIALISFLSDDFVEAELTKTDLFKLVRLTKEASKRGGKLKIALNGIGKKHYAEIAKRAKFFCKQSEIDDLKAEFSHNEGYLAEFLYRIKQGEKIENIKSSNNSVSYSKGSDTKDGKQIKMFKTFVKDGQMKINGASLATLEKILESCKEQGIDTSELIKAIETLEALY